MVIIFSKIDEQHDPDMEKKLQTSQRLLYFTTIEKIEINTIYQQCMATRVNKTIIK